MKTQRLLSRGVLLIFVCVSSLRAQKEGGPANPAGAPPKLLLLVHQEIQFGKEGERKKLEMAVTRACEHLDVPNSWIDLESLTGAPEALFFDPLDSFEQLDNVSFVWSRLLAAHPEIARMQEEIKTVVGSERTSIAVRRDDLGYRVNDIDFSKARFLRVLEVRLYPGHESDFVEAFKILGDAYQRIDANMPWVVYQVNVGMPSPTFLVFVPMRALKENDDLLARRASLGEAEGEAGSQRMEQIARESYTSTESNLYAVSPEMSHVAKEFAEGDAEFWSPKRPAEGTKLPGGKEEKKPPKSAEAKKQ